jgi:hypothetical protein
MTPARLQEIRERHAKATKGPMVAIPVKRRWHFHETPVFDDGMWDILPAEDMERLPVISVDRGDDHDSATRKSAADDAQFFAHSWQDISDLLAHVERLEGISCPNCCGTGAAVMTTEGGDEYLCLCNCAAGVERRKREVEARSK